MLNGLVEVAAYLRLIGCGVAKRRHGSKSAAWLTGCYLVYCVAHRI